MKNPFFLVQNHKDGRNTSIPNISRSSDPWKESACLVVFRIQWNPLCHPWEKLNEKFYFSFWGHLLLGLPKNLGIAKFLEEKRTKCKEERPIYPFSAKTFSLLSLFQEKFSFRKVLKKFFLLLFSPGPLATRTGI